MSIMDVFNGSVDTLTSILGASFVGSIIGSFVNSIWVRRTAKKAPKTEMRAEAYRDFVVQVVSRGGRANNAAGNNDSFGNADDEIKARLLLFGESGVVEAVDGFLTHHRGLDTEEARNRFADVILAMRKSLLTGHRRVRGSVLNLITKPTFGS